MKSNYYYFNRPFHLILSYFALLVLFAGCKKDTPAEIQDLKFPLDTYYISEGDEVLLYINSGNQKYSLSAQNKDLIQANVNSADWPAGNILVKGLKIGSTQLTVKDDVTGQEAKLQIHVVDPYLALKAGGLFPLIKGADLNTEQAIRKEVSDNLKALVEFEQGEILILQRTADQRFSVFKNAEELARGNADRSGNYTMSFDFGGPNRFTLKYDNSDKKVEVAIHTSNENIFTTLLDFAGNSPFKRNQTKTSTNSSRKSPGLIKLSESPVESPGLYLFRDFTEHFQKTFAGVEEVELVHDMRFFNAFEHPKFGEGVLK